MKIMITGSERINHLNSETVQRITNITNLKAEIVLGNYRGADQAVLKHLHRIQYPFVTVYETGSGISFGYSLLKVGQYPAQDIEMRKISDFCLALYDGKSSGTWRNIKAFPNRCRIVYY